MKKGYQLIIFRDLKSVNPNDDNVEVRITFPNGKSYTTTFFTLQNIKSRIKTNKEDGECASGAYFWAPHMVIVKQLNEEVIRETIDSILAENQFRFAFLTDGGEEEVPEEMSEAEEEKLLQEFFDYLNEPHSLNDL